jgi:purine nucleosidase
MVKSLADLQTRKMSAQRILLDCDPGIDDSLAILLALASQEIELEAITVTHGNCSVDQGVRNALQVLELAGYPSIPVAKGAQVPLVKPLLLAPETHGDTGIGYARLPEPKTQAVEQHAVKLLIDKVMAAPGEISIVAVGPLTNLALAIRLEPEFIRAVKNIVIMGGAVKAGGNTTPLAEFNTYCDPHAARIVFRSGIPQTLIPLDATYQIVLTTHDIGRLQALNTPISNFIFDATRFYMEFHAEYQDIQGCVINDPLTLACFIDPGLLQLEEHYIDVDISGGVSMGKTFADFYKINQQLPNMQVALDVDARGFVELFLQRMETLCG